MRARYDVFCLKARFPLCACRTCWPTYTKPLVQYEVGSWSVNSQRPTNPRARLAMKPFSRGGSFHHRGRGRRSCLTLGGRCYDQVMESPGRAWSSAAFTSALKPPRDSDSCTRTQHDGSVGLTTYRLWHAADKSQSRVGCERPRKFHCFVSANVVPTEVELCRVWETTTIMTVVVVTLHRRRQWMHAVQPGADFDERAVDRKCLRKLCCNTDTVAGEVELHRSKRRMTVALHQLSIYSPKGGTLRWKRHAQRTSVSVRFAASAFASSAAPASRMSLMSRLSLARATSQRSP